MQIRRGTDAERQTVIFLEGEIIYTTDNKDLWVGDGVTLGGVQSQSLGEAPEDGTPYAREDATWVNTINALVEDTSPHLGGELNTGGFNIQSDAASDLILRAPMGGQINVPYSATNGDGNNISFATKTNLTLGSVEVFEAGTRIAGSGSTAVENYITLRNSNTAGNDQPAKLNIGDWTLTGADGLNGQVLVTDGAGNLTWTTNSAAGLAAVVDDPAPHLGGTLNTDGYAINLDAGIGANIGSILASMTQVDISSSSALNLHGGGGRLLLQESHTYGGPADFDAMRGFITVSGLTEQCFYAGMRVEATGATRIPFLELVNSTTGQSPELRVGDWTMTGADGTVGQVLTTDGAGNVTFEDGGGSLVEIGGYTELAGTATAVDASTHNHTAISGTQTLSFTNVPNGVYTCNVVITAGTVTWPANVKWVDGTAPTLTAATDVVTLMTVDNGTNWLGSYSLGYA